MCVYMYIYIYINLVGPGNSLDVSIISVTFPSRFCYVSVNFSAAFPARFRQRFRRVFVRRLVPDGNCPTNHAGYLFGCFFGQRRPSEAQAKPILAQWFRPRLSTCGLGFEPPVGVFGVYTYVYIYMYTYTCYTIEIYIYIYIYIYICARSPARSKQQRVRAPDATRAPGSHEFE